MCGIVGVLAKRDVIPILLNGLRRLEYRGYDSAGIAIINQSEEITVAKVAGKVNKLVTHLSGKPMHGYTGIAHTRWATHGPPIDNNAHPHICRGEVAVVHNGIIENQVELRSDLSSSGYSFDSETDSEVIVNQIHKNISLGIEPFEAVSETTKVLQGTYALGIIFKNCPDRIIATRHGSPLVIGIGNDEYYIASDIFALLPITNKYIVLEEGDIADISLEHGIRIIDSQGKKADRSVIDTEMRHDELDKLGFRHYMQKEIFQQPQAVKDTFDKIVVNNEINIDSFGEKARNIFKHVKAVHLVACGTSYHAGLVSRHWFESIAKINCTIDIASEYRYYDGVIQEGTLFIVISQSGETADTLAALNKAKDQNYLATFSICNVVESSITRESDFGFITAAGMEIGVASTKAFTTQLTTLILLALAISNECGTDASEFKNLLGELKELPKHINKVLKLDPLISKLAEQFVNKHNALYLGRGAMLPIAMEGALKLKEISYIHAEAYAAGELKHGPLALVDNSMPIIAVAPNNDLLQKLISNLQEVHARGGELYVIADKDVILNLVDSTHRITLDTIANIIAPIVYIIPLQLLAYHIAVLKGADIDQPRNLAKSVTVE